MPVPSPMLTSTPEVEIKFEVPDLKALARSLRRAGFRVRTPRTFESNTLYDLPGKTLRKQGQLLRLRQYGKAWTLTHKAKARIGRHKTRAETETQVHDGKLMDRILLALGYRPGFRYEKYRTEWGDRRGHVVVDETPIGNFAEIEGPPAWIDRTAAELGISKKQYITASYAELFFAWKRRIKSPAQEMTFPGVKAR